MGNHPITTGIYEHKLLTFFFSLWSHCIMTSIPISAQESYILTVKQQRKHFMFDWQKRLQPLQEIISSLTYYEGLTCHRFERSSWTNYVIISVRLRSEYISTSHRLSLSLCYYVFSYISTDIDSLINQNVQMWPLRMTVDTSYLK